MTDAEKLMEIAELHCPGERPHKTSNDLGTFGLCAACLLPHPCPTHRIARAG